MKYVGVMALAAVLAAAASASVHYEYGIVSGAIVGILTMLSTKGFWS